MSSIKSSKKNISNCSEILEVALAIAVVEAVTITPQVKIARAQTTRTITKATA